MNPINPSFPNNPNPVAAPQFPGSVPNTQYPGYTFYEGQYQPQQAPEGYQWGYSALNQGEVPPPLPPSEDLPKPPPENQTYWYKIADPILRNSAFTCVCILTCRFLCFSSYTFSLLESVIFWLVDFILCQCFDYSKTSLSVENENFVQEFIYLFHFYWKLKFLNLKACTCTYLNLLNILVILYICCTFFQTNQQLFYYGRYYFIHTE